MDFLLEVNLNTIMILLVALINLYAAIITKKTYTSIDTLEKNTNSIKDALVASTAMASHAEGMVAGKLEEKVEEQDRKDARRK